MTGDGTRVIRAGLPEASQGDPIRTGPVLTSTYHLRGDLSGGPTYGRMTNPTWTMLELALGELEGGRAVCFASGMAAVTAALASTVPPGGTLTLLGNGYHGVKTLARNRFEPAGITVREVRDVAALDEHTLTGSDVIWLETPSNPMLEVYDIGRIRALATDVGARLIIDNTTATPLAQRCLDLGADLVVASDTKWLAGHSDVLLGHVAGRDEALVDAVIAYRTDTGAIAGPFEAWLVHRSLATLDVRLERSAANALAIATALSSHPAVTVVHYPWLPDDPGHALALAQMRRPVGLLSFELRGRGEAEALLGAATLIDEATSFGAVHTMAERRARWPADDAPEGLVRLSVGCENADDLVADLLAAADTLL